MNTADGVMLLQNPATARKKYTPAIVQIKRFVCTDLMLLTKPQNSHIVIPVTKANRNTIAKGLRKQVTMRLRTGCP